MTAGERASTTPLSQSSPVLSKLLGLGEGIVIGDSSEDQFLDPDVAFVLSAAAVGPDAIETRWDIAEGYYLYREKFRFRSADGSGASLGVAGFPKGKVKDDEYFGPMEVYYGSVAALVPVAGAATGDVIDVDVTYQGCADAGLCYPPITRTVSLLIPAALADTGGGAGPGAGVSSLSDAASGAWRPDLRPSRPGKASSSTLRTHRDSRAPERSSCRSRTASPPRSCRATAGLVILSLFGAGLLLTFTPCVLPMVPILTSIIVGRGAEPGSGAASTRRAFTLSLVYVLAMALTYTVAGVLAGLFGANLAAAFQDPWIVSAFVLVFVLLALSMFGFYELQMPASWQAGLAPSAIASAAGPTPGSR